MANNQLSLAVTAQNLYIQGLEVVYGSATTVTITAGQCRDSNNEVDMFLYPSNTLPANQGFVYAPLTLTTTTVGINGVDVALAAATAALYQVFLISASDNSQPIACIATLGLNSPTVAPLGPVMPFGYDTLRLIGYFAVDASDNVLKAYTAGNGNVQDFFYDAPPATAITAGASTSYAVVDLSAQVPWVNQTPVQIRYNFNANAGIELTHKFWRFGFASNNIFSLFYPINKQFTNTNFLYATLHEFNHDYVNLGYGICAIENANIYQMEFNLTGYFKVTPETDAFQLGLFYRTWNEIGFIFGIDLTSNLKLTYSYDYNISGISSSSFGSHEIIFSYRLDRVWKCKNCWY